MQSARARLRKPCLRMKNFNIALDTVRLDAFKGWANSKPEEGATREQNYYLLQAIERLKENLTALVQNAKFEQHKVEISETEKGEKV
jgi:hypothetical protein